MKQEHTIFQFFLLEQPEATVSNHGALFSTTPSWVLSLLSAVLFVLSTGVNIYSKPVNSGVMQAKLFEK